MNLSYQELLPENFSPASRVWIYQCNRLLGMSEVLAADQILQSFVQNWQTHGDPVKGFATLLFGQFIIIIADETGAGVSGCSTDSSVRAVKDIEAALNVQFFDRQLLAFAGKEKAQLIPLAQFLPAIHAGLLQKDSLYFNNTAGSLEELKNNWIIPVEYSWLRTKLPSADKTTA